MPQQSESRDLDKVIVRLPDGMRDRLKIAAAENNRSMNAEIVARLEESFSYDERSGDFTHAIESVTQTLNSMQEKAEEERKWTWGIIEALVNDSLTPERIDLLRPLFPERRRRLKELDTKWRYARKTGDKEREAELRREIENLAPRYFERMLDDDGSLF